MRNLLQAAACVALVAVASCEVNAQEPVAMPPLCLDRLQIADRLDQKWDEAPAVRFLLNGVVVEIFAAPDSGSMTIIETYPNGCSVVLGAGRGFELLQWGAQS